MMDFSKMKEGAQNSSSEYTLEWTEKAKARVERVPKGFMRGMTIKRVEGYAEEIDEQTITLEIAEKSLANSASMMGSMMGGEQSSDPVAKPKEIQNNDVLFFSCFLCGYSLKGYAPVECPICRSMQHKFLEVAESDLSEASCRIMQWDAKASAWLNAIPDGFMREMGRWRMEKFCRSSGIQMVSMTEIDKKSGNWQQGAQKIETELLWDEDALQKVQKIPEFIRGTIQAEVEKVAKANGVEKITVQELIHVREKWEKSGQFHSR